MNILQKLIAITRNQRNPLRYLSECVLYHADKSICEIINIEYQSMLEVQEIARMHEWEASTGLPRV